MQVIQEVGVGIIRPIVVAIPRIVVIGEPLCAHLRIHFALLSCVYSRPIVAVLRPLPVPIIGVIIVKLLRLQLSLLMKLFFCYLLLLFLIVVLGLVLALHLRPAVITIIVIVVTIVAVAATVFGERRRCSER